MKQPKFKGIDKETGQWVFGFGWCETDYTDQYLNELEQETQDAILFTDHGPIVCHLDTMAPYTGEMDANDNEIYWGDILQPSNNERKFYTVVWVDGGFKKKYHFIRTYQGEKWEESNCVPLHAKYVKVVGNIFEQDEPINE